MRNKIPWEETDRIVALACLVQGAGYHFVTTTPATHARVNTRPESAWARDLRDVFGWSQRFRPEIMSNALFEAMQRAEVVAVDADGFRSRIRFSNLDGLLLAHSAYPTTEPDSVFFGPDTYRFAHAIERMLDRPVRRAIDVGAGTGAGAILVARANPQAEVLAVDINPAALAATKANAELAGVRVQAVRSDLFAATEGGFDLIVANPPYMADPDQRAYRHGGGPFGGGLSLAILQAALDRLSPGGTLLLYTGAAVVNGVDTFQIAAMSHLKRASFDWRYLEMDPDVFGEELDRSPYDQVDRIAAVCLTVRKR